MKIWDLLSKLSAREQTEFERWYGHEFDEKTRQVVSQLIHANSTGQRILLYEQVLPNVLTKKSDIQNLISKSTRLLEEYYAIRQLKKNTTLKDHLLIEALKDRELEVQLGHTIKLSYNRLKKQTYKDSKFYQAKYSLHLEQAKHLIKSGELTTSELEHIQDSLDIWGLIEKFKIGILFNSFSQVYKQAPELRAMQIAVNLYKQNPALQQSAILSIYCLQYCISSKDESAIPKLQKLLAERSSEIDYEARINSFDVMLNYYIQKSNQDGGKSSYAHQLFELYSFGIKHNLLIRKKYLSPNHLKNLVECGIRAEKIQEVEKYMEELKEYLPAHQRSEVIRFNRANILFAKRDLPAVIRELSKKRFNNIFWEVHAKSLHLQAYYEMGDQDWVLKEVSKFLRNVKGLKNISNYHKQSHANRLELFIELIKAKSTDELFHLKDKVLHTSPIDNHEWLLASIDKKIRQLNKLPSQETE